MSVFLTFGPSVEGFKHCRPIIQIDSTFLYGKYIWTIAFAIVEEESQDSWFRFLIALRHHITQREWICLISDRHVGINVAIRNP